MRRRYLRLWGPDLRAEIEAEIEFHIETRARELIAAGAAPDDAMRRARAEFGNADEAKRLCREIDARRLGRVQRAEAAESLWYDARAAVRALWRARGYSLAVILTLALAIAGATVVFSAVNAVLLRPLPFAEPDRLVRLHSTVQGKRSTFSPPNFMDVRAHSRTLRNVAAWHPDWYTITGQSAAERLRAARITAGFFEALGVRMAAGRAPAAEEMEPGRDRVVVVSHGLWRGRFGGDPGIVGRHVMLEGEAHTVVGVAPPDFAFPEETELWTPRSFDSDVYATQRGAQYLYVLARLAPGVSLDQAQAELTQIGLRLERAYPDNNTDRSVEAMDLRESIVGSFRRPLYVLLGAVLFVLLIAALNAANLGLVRALGRARELAVRAALGARRGRILRLLLTENAILALVAGVLGALLALWGVRLLVLSFGTQVPRLADAAVDPAALAFALLCAAAAGLLAGLLPALRYSKATDLYARLADAGRSRTVGRSGARARGALVALELALALLLLVGAGLLLRSFERLREVDVGFRSEGLLTATLALPETRYETPASNARFYATLLEQVRALPAAEAAGAVMAMPLSGTRYGISVEELDGQPAYSAPGEEKSVQVRIATPGYFEAAGIPVLRGRPFTGADREGAPLAVVLSEAAAQLLWPGQDPIGRTVELGTRLGLGSQRPRVGGTVVGIVGDVHEFGPAEPAPALLYAAHAQFPVEWMTIAVRSAGDPTSLAAPLRAIVRAMDPEVPLSDVASGEELLGEALRRDRFYSRFIALFAVAALLLAAVGVYGITASAVASRTREIGIRVALGAAADDVLRLVLQRSILFATIGIVAGLAGAYALTRVLRALLFELSPTDPATIATVTAVLAAVAALAAWLPARHATRVDPVIALREE